MKKIIILGICICVLLSIFFSAGALSAAPTAGSGANIVTSACTSDSCKNIDNAWLSAGKKLNIVNAKEEKVWDPKNSWKTTTEMYAVVSYLREKIISFASQEVDYWNKAEITEASQCESRLKEYFTTAKCAGTICQTKTDRSISVIPWSAAFISYIMNKAGVSFPQQCVHFGYFAAIRDKTTTSQYGCTATPFNGDDLSEVKVGDLLCKCYSSATTCSINYNERFNPAIQETAHCDIVVSKTAETMMLVGGNVGDKVTKRQFTVDSKKPYFARISCD